MVVKPEELANMSMIEILENAIEREIDSCNYYRCAANCVGDDKIKELLIALSSIEEGHRKQLEGHLAELKAHLELSRAMTIRYERG